MNILLLADSYKYTMHKLYPPKTEYVYSYIESRGGVYDKTLFFGLQGFLKTYLKPITKEDIDYAEDLITKHIGPNVFNRSGWDYILEKYNGNLPLEIKALPEGSLVNTNNILLSVVNTDPKCYWLTTFIETALLKGIWYPTTVATRSYYIKQILKEYNELNGTEDIDFKFVDFGYRGVSSTESAMIGGCAHLVNFKATDNIAALEYARNNYGCDIAGYSVPASEHSISSSWANEIDGFENILDQYTGIVSYVSDTYDIFKICDELVKLKDKIEVPGRTLVIRPDSGKPVEVILKCLRILKQHFTTDINEKGFEYFKHIKILWGDGITDNEIQDILEQLHFNGYSSDIMIFGAGGYLLQQLNRDTCKFAMKASAVCIDGVWKDIYKDPITDPGKKSKSGKLAITGGYSFDGTYNYATFKLDDMVVKNDGLTLAYKDGIIYANETLDQIREKT